MVFAQIFASMQNGKSFNLLTSVSCENARLLKQKSQTVETKFTKSRQIAESPLSGSKASGLRERYAQTPEGTRGEPVQ